MRMTFLYIICHAYDTGKYKNAGTVIIRCGLRCRLLLAAAPIFILIFLTGYS